MRFPKAAVCDDQDELLECGLVRRSPGTLDQITVPPAPLDILAQQLVAASASQTWVEEDLFRLCRRAFPYRALSRDDFNAVVRMLADGIATQRGRGLAYLYHDRINHRIKGRRGARLAAITSGGAIPDTANYAVVAEPDGTVVGSVDEDFAVGSLAGDIMLLGNTSWRIKGVEAGKVRVEGAQGAPPSIPFWRGDAPSRTAELSAEVASLRHEIATQASSCRFRALSPQSSVPSCLGFAKNALDPRCAQQITNMWLAALLGVVPTQETVPPNGSSMKAGMQLVTTPVGGRINKAWGLRHANGSV